MTRAFNHLVLVCAFLLSMISVEPHSRSKQKLSKPYLKSHYDHFYQAAMDWWKKEALSLEPPSFPSGSSPNFSCRIPGSGMLTPVGDFTMDPAFSKSMMPSRLKAPSYDSIKSDYSACRKVADLESVQTLHLFLHNSVVAFKADPTQHDPQGVWASISQLLSGIALALQPLLMDALGSVCRAWAKLHRKMLQNAPVIIKQLPFCRCTLWTLLRLWWS